MQPVQQTDPAVSNPRPNGRLRCAAQQPPHTAARFHARSARVLEVLGTLFLFLLLSSCTTPPHGSYVPPESLRTQPWYSHYADNDLDSACVLLEGRLDKHKDELPTLLYYAETLRRLKRLTAADSVVDRALAIDERSGFGWRIKGDIRNAQFTGSDSVFSGDSSVYYYRKATEVDPNDCVTWELLWITAMREGDSAREHSALRHLHTCGTYTRSAYEFARWLLSLLPDSAVLLTNGDMDTYPLRVLQEAKQLRRDVAVVNVSLLNLKEYYRYVCRYQGIPTTFTDDELAAVEHRLADGEVETIAAQLLSGWIERAKLEQFGRPLCAAVTVSKNLLPTEFREAMALKGPYFLMTDSEDPYGDPDTLEAAVRLLDIDELAGPFISDDVVSPVMLKVRGTRSLDANFLAAALSAAIGYKKAQQDGKALGMVEWVEAYLTAVGNDDANLADKVRMLRAHIAGDER